ncbi:protein fem-1C-like [Sesbania bispinosa]|nr:protein fem-1C-like [Sesbania bispinosa]
MGFTVVEGDCRWRIWTEQTAPSARWGIRKPQWCMVVIGRRKICCYLLETGSDIGEEGYVAYHSSCYGGCNGLGWFYRIEQKNDRVATTATFKEVRD